MSSSKQIVDGLVDAAAIAAGAAALLVALVAYRSATARPPVADRASEVVQNWEDYAEEGRWIGPPEAALVIVEFGDYECPACRALHSTLVRLRASYPQDVAISYRHWPLPYHRSAYPAARAAECAGSQGVFEAYHDALFTEDDWLGEALLRFAKGAGVPDLDAFEQCIAETDPVPRIERDIAAVAELGAIGTPTLIVNGVMSAGVPSYQELEAAIPPA